MSSSDEIEQAAREFLYERVGNLVGPGVPTFDKEADNWRVPVIHQSKLGEFRLGEMELSKDGKILRAPSRKELQEMVEEKLSRSVIRIDIVTEKMKPIEIQKLINKLKPLSVGVTIS